MSPLRRVGRTSWLTLAVLVAACGGPTKPTPVPPVVLTLTCPADIAAESRDGQAVQVSFGLPQPAGGTPPVVVSCTPASGGAFAVGATAVTCAASDSGGRSHSCQFTVRVVPPPRLMLTRFLAFGDSLTEGKLGLNPSFRSVVFEGSYSTMLQSALSTRYSTQTIVVIHEGVGGERVLGVTEHSPGGVVRLPQTLSASRPEVLLLMEGSNDLGAGREAALMAIDGLQDMIEKAKERGVRIFLATIPPVRAGGLRHRDEAAALVPEFNQNVRALAVREGVTLVDVYQAMQNRMELIGPDDLHLTREGYQVVAQTFFDAIKATLEAPAAVTVW